MDVDVNKLFEGTPPIDGLVLGIDTPKPQKATTSFPGEIKTMADVRTFLEASALNYSKGIRLYRGHESKEYKLESTIARLLKQAKKECPIQIQEILSAERRGFDLFCKDVFKDEWLKHKSKHTDETLFKMSIGRHLGLPCRLIDVTASLETAVWFAVADPRHYNEDGEIILIVLDKEKALGENRSPFYSASVSYSHEAFLADSLDDLPLGEQRRFIQNGHFIWADDTSLLNEETAISNFSYYVKRVTIPWQSKLSLAIDLYRDVYSGCAYQSDIIRIKKIIQYDISRSSFPR